MLKLKLYVETQKAEFEPNSVAGKAIDYILNRWTQLSQFLRHAHAPLDTNIVERALKLVIQVRKSSMFYKSLSSAAFASFVQSALYSAAQNDINPCEYMCALIDNEVVLYKIIYMMSHSLTERSPKVADAIHKRIEISKKRGIKR